MSNFPGETDIVSHVLDIKQEAGGTISANVSSYHPGDIITITCEETTKELDHIRIKGIVTPVGLIDIYTLPFTFVAPDRCLTVVPYYRNKRNVFYVDTTRQDIEGPSTITKGQSGTFIYTGDKTLTRFVDANSGKLYYGNPCTITPTNDMKLYAVYGTPGFYNIRKSVISFDRGFISGAVYGPDNASSGDIITFTSECTDGNGDFQYWRIIEYDDATFSHQSAPAYNIYTGNSLSIKMGNGAIEIEAVYSWKDVHIVGVPKPNDTYGTVVLTSSTQGEVEGSIVSIGRNVTLKATSIGRNRFIEWSTGETTTSISFQHVRENILRYAIFRGASAQKLTFKPNDDNLPDAPNSCRFMLRGESADKQITQYYLEPDESIDVYVIENLGYKFINWDKSISLNQRSRKFAYTGTYDRNYTAYCTYVGYSTVSVEQTDGGDVRLIKHTTEDRELQLGITTHPVNLPVTVGHHLTLEATPFAGYKFDHWEVNGYKTSITDNPGEFRVNAHDTTVYSAVFKPTSPTATHRITISANRYNDSLQHNKGAGWIVVTKPDGKVYSGYIYDRATYEVPEGSQVEIYHYSMVQNNNVKYYFATWSDAEDDNIYGQFAGRKWSSLLEDLDLIIYYNAECNINCIASPYQGGRFVLVRGTHYEEGRNFKVGRDSHVTIQATAYPGYSFVEWVDTGSTIPVREETITEDVEFTALFQDNGGEKQKFHITAKCIPEDGGVVQGTGWIQVGTTARLEAIPNTGHSFKYWGNKSTNPVVSFIVTNDVHLSAYFTGGGGGGLPSLWHFINKKKYGTHLIIKK